MRELEFENNLSAEVPDEHQTLSGSPRRADSQDADPLHIIELMPVIQPSAGQVTQEQHDDTAAETSHKHLARTDTEQFLGDEITPMESPFSQSLPSRLPTDRRRTDRLMSKASPTWRGYHQDLNASKWFKSIQIFIIFSVIVVALVLYLFISPIFATDIFATQFIFILIYLFLSPILGVFCIVIGGIFRSKVFR